MRILRSMKNKRVKYNWLFIIDDLGLTERFKLFVEDNNLKQHIVGKKELSRNRLARAFIKRFCSLIVQNFICKCPCYIVGQEEPFDHWCERCKSEVSTFKDFSV